ncbi:MAG: hypothetical protein QOE36_2656 [Gaiellaceae bacterium]|nr:hypothetical protein [Gaiellaceae bacterium]
MTRVLFACAPGDGHYHPLLPLARAFAEAGHEVAFATAPAFGERVEAEGFTFLQAGIDSIEARALFEPYAAEHQALPLEERRAFIFSLLFGRIEAPAKLADLRAAVRDWRPDLVVHETADLAAPIAAAELELPTVHHSFGRLHPRDTLARAVAETEPLWREVGLEPEPYGGMFRGIYLDIAPPSLQTDPLPDGARVQLLRPVPVASVSAEPAPEWLGRLPERPTVHVTLGTVFNDLAVFRLLLEGLADVDCNVVGTVGRNRDPAELAPLPANARVERYIPQSFLLPHCSVVVTHGGSGSTLGALAHGLPMLLVPRGADQFDNAERCTAIGVAKRLLPDELTSAAVRSAVESLLADASYSERARVVAEEIAAMPAAAEVVALLVSGPPP